ncbi:MAG: HEPN domain-containing protein [Methanoregulaceae archaeon]|jgi:uncharacterized protein (UPF0332 family)
MIEDLVKEGLITPLPVNQNRVEDTFAIAYRDLGVAENLLTSSSDWAYTVAYNAILQAGRALLFAKGYRPSGSNQHISVVRFCEHFLSRDETLWFERMRRKRHQAVYDCAGTISEHEARSAVKKAGDILQTIDSLLRA